MTGSEAREDARTIQPASEQLGASGEVAVEEEEGADVLSHHVVPVPEGHGEFLWQVHRYLNDYIRFSDKKSGVAIAVALAMVGALGTSDVLRTLAAAAPSAWTPEQWLMALSLLLLLGGLLVAGISISPRLRNTQPRGFIFWESIRAHRGSHDFLLSLARQSRADLDAHLATHVHALALVTSKKFYWSSWSIVLTICGGLLAGVSLLLQAMD